MSVTSAPKRDSHAVDDHLDVDLRQAGDDLLAGLLVAVQVDRRVLLLQAPQGGVDLVLVALVLGLHGEGHDRRRELDPRHVDRLVARRQPVAGVGLLELGDGADVARAERVGVADLLAARHEQLADALLVMGAGVHHLRVVGHRALVDAEEVDAARERVGARLEHVGEHLALGVGLEREALLDLDAPCWTGRREVVDDRVEQAVGAQAGRGDAAGDREDVAVVGALLERVDDLVVGDLLALEVALHQRLGVLGDLVHQLLAVLLGLVGELVRDRDLRAVAVGVVLVGLHVHEVDQAAQLVLGADRDLGGDDVRAERLLERVERAEEVGPLAVEHVHVDQPRDAQLLRALPQPARGDLDAHHAVDDEDRGLAHAQRAERVGDEAGLAGRVDQVDLDVAPLEGGQRRRDGHAAGLLVLVGVRDRRTVSHRAEPGRRAGLEQQGLVQRRLPAPSVAH